MKDLSSRRQALRPGALAGEIGSLVLEHASASTARAIGSANLPGAPLGLSEALPARVELNHSREAEP
jgi:hypothetical protein